MIFKNLKNFKKIKKIPREEGEITSHRLMDRGSQELSAKAHFQTLLFLSDIFLQAS